MIGSHLGWGGEWYNALHMPRARKVQEVDEAAAAGEVPLSSPESVETKPKRVRRPRVAATADGDTPPAPRRRTRRFTPVMTAPESLPEEEVVSPVVEREVDPTPRRKAPVRVVPASGATRTVRTRSVVPVVVMVGVFFSGIGLSAAVGLTDKGTIDVVAKMQEQSALQAGMNGDSASDGQDTGQVIPVQNTPVNVPNGGLRGRGVGSEPPPPPPPPLPASTTATSTEAATGTVSVAEGSVPAKTEESVEEESAPAQVVSPDTETSPSL